MIRTDTYHLCSQRAWSAFDMHAITPTAGLTCVQIPSPRGDLAALGWKFIRVHVWSWPVHLDSTFPWPLIFHWVGSFKLTQQLVKFWSLSAGMFNSNISMYFAKQIHNKLTNVLWGVLKIKCTIQFRHTNKSLFCLTNAAKPVEQMYYYRLVKVF